VHISTKLSQTIFKIVDKILMKNTSCSGNGAAKLDDRVDTELSHGLAQ